jgi:hypothetical protein
MAKRDHMDLMQHFDGELSSDDAAEVRAQLASSQGDDEDNDDALVIESLRQISELTRGHLELAADEVDEAEPRFESMWQTIERRVTANGKTEEAAVPRTRSQPAQSAPGMFASVKRWLSEQRGYLATGTLAAGAAAAIMFFALGAGGDGNQDGRQAGTRAPIAATQINNADKPCVPAPSVPMLSEPAAVEELSVTDGTGYILTIPGDDGETDTTVIWIEPEDKLESPI